MCRILLQILLMIINQLMLRTINFFVIIKYQVFYNTFQTTMDVIILNLLSFEWHWHLLILQKKKNAKNTSMTSLVPLV